MEMLDSLFNESSFMPHGHCYLWTPSLIWLEVFTNLAIGLSYIAISVALILFVRRVQDLPLRFVYVAFGTFIVACGMTHLMDVWVIWQPHYWLDAGLRAVTAIASVTTALLLPRMTSHAVHLIDRTRQMRRQGVVLQSAMRDLETMYERTRELDQLKSDFFANVSHELRTPLTLVLAPLEELRRRSDLPADAVTQFDTIARDATRLLAYVNDLLNVQKLDAGKLLPIFGMTCLAQLVRGAVAQFESLARERDIELRVATPVTFSAEVDSEKIRLVLLSLLSNAFRFTPLGGTVEVELSRALDEHHCAVAVLRVCDSGPGIAAEDREFVFERLSQDGSSDEQRAGGTGLGLAIVRELLGLHAGSISVGDRVLGGTVFEARWPVAMSASAPVVGVPLVVTRTVEPPRPLNKPRVQEVSARDDLRASVLVADDNADMRELIVSLMSPHYRVVSAKDGEEALACMRARTPDLIVSDVMMPKVSGEQLVHAVREIAAFDGVPILLLTAQDDEALRARLVQSGAHDYLLKPFDHEEFLARVHNLVSMRRTRLLLQREVVAQQVDVEALSRAVVLQKHSLEAALGAMKLAREEAEQASRSKTDFLTLVSHELRTPLASILLQLERLNRGIAGALSDAQTQTVSAIRRSSARLLAMVESMVQFGRLETGRLDVAALPVDVLILARETIDELRARADEKSLSLRIESSAESVPLRSDPELVRLVLVNLCENAIKYTRAGEIVMSVERQADGVVSVSVRDTGLGIAHHEQDRIFLPFVQLEPVRHKKGAGAGLGLALVKRIAEALHAEVRLTSELGVGSTFTVTFHQAPAIDVAPD